jgi:hypothetical protein
MAEGKDTEFSSKERVEPSFVSLEKNGENTLNTIENHSSTMQDSNYNNIPSFLKRNRD